MCTKRPVEDVCRPVARLDLELGPTLRELVLGGPSHTRNLGVNKGDHFEYMDAHVGGAWVGGYAFYSQMANV